MTAVSYRVPDLIRGLHTYVTYLKCDGRDATGNYTICRQRISGRASETRPIARRAEGWQVGPPKDYCPEHRTDR